MAVRSAPMSTDHPGTDRTFLRDDQYRDERNLEARRAIYAHAVEGGDFITPAVEALQGARSVLDVGCGPGVWHELLGRAQPGCRWIGVDLSTGMATAAAAAGHTAVGVADAVALPVPDDAVDAALSVHMLYHVPRPEQPSALGELARVVRPGGPVVVTTNGSDHLTELDELLVAAGTDVGLGLPPVGFSLSFLLDDAGLDLLSEVFDCVQTVHARGRLEIPDAELVARYIGSLGSLPELGEDAPDRDGISELVAAARRRAQQIIDRHGAFAVHTHSGVFVAHS
jgi:SAM-dependent methyltransferase